MDYYAEDAKKEIERRKAEAEEFAAAWSGVTRKYKKNGEAFANIGQNFEGAHVEASPYSITPEKRLSVRANYKSDYVDMQKTVYSGSEEAAAYEKAGRLEDRGAFLHPCVKYTVDELEEIIKSRAEYYKKYAEDLGQILEDFDKIAGRLVELREEAEAICAKSPAEYVLRGIFTKGRA